MLLDNSLDISSWVMDETARAQSPVRHGSTCVWMALKCVKRYMAWYAALSSAERGRGSKSSKSVWGAPCPGSCRPLKDSASNASELCQLSDTALHHTSYADAAAACATHRMIGLCRCDDPGTDGWGVQRTTVACTDAAELDNLACVPSCPQLIRASGQS